MALHVAVDEQCEDTLQGTLLRGTQRQEYVDGNKRSARALPFTVTGDMMPPNSWGAPEVGGFDEHNAALKPALVADAFARLPAEHRAVVRRAFYYGWSTAQISTDLRIPDAAVKSRLHDALRTLRRTLREMGAEQ